MRLGYELARKCIIALGKAHGVEFNEVRLHLEAKEAAKWSTPVANQLSRDLILEHAEGNEHAT